MPQKKSSSRPLTKAAIKKVELDEIQPDNIAANFVLQHPNLEHLSFGEADTFRELFTYILNTYGEHYMGKNRLQVNHLLVADGIAKDFWRGNIIKYVARYGAKGGANRKDLMKAAHYLILLLGHERDYENK